MNPPTVTGIVSNAIASVRADSSLRLSTQSELLMYAAEGAVSMALGKNIQDVAVATLRAISDEIGQVAADLLSDVPLVGQAIGFVLDAAESIIASNKAEAAAQKEAALSQFSDMYKRYPVKASGSNGQSVPADIFAPYHPLRSDTSGAVRSDWSWRAFGAGHRPFLGDVMVRLLEPLMRLDNAGKPYESEGEYRGTWAPALMFSKEHKGELSLATRRKIQMIRRAIQVQWVPPYGSEIAQSGLPGFGFGTRAHPSCYSGQKCEWWLASLVEPVVGAPRVYFPKRGLVDGGVALWPVLMDLLAAEADAKRLTESNLEFAARFAYAPRDTIRYFPGPPGGGKPVWDLIQSWRATVHPSYKQDVAALKAMRAEVDAALRKAREKRQPKTRFVLRDLKNVRKPKAKGHAAAAAGVAGAGVAALWYLGFL